MRLISLSNPVNSFTLLSAISTNCLLHLIPESEIVELELNLPEPMNTPLNTHQ
jgi:hypothetical protein